jgi:hypothetical protein
MAGGSEKKENPTDQQCEHCGLWFSKRGHYSHTRNCPANVPTNDQSETTKVTMPSETTEETEETDENDTLYCPDCGNKDDDTEPKIFYANDIKKKYSDELPEKDKKTLSNHEYFCQNCNSAFDN